MTVDMVDMVDMIPTLRAREVERVGIGMSRKHTHHPHHLHHGTDTPETPPMRGTVRPGQWAARPAVVYPQLWQVRTGRKPLTLRQIQEARALGEQPGEHPMKCTEKMKSTQRAATREQISAVRARLGPVKKGGFDGA